MLSETMATVKSVEDDIKRVRWQHKTARRLLNESIVAQLDADVAKARAATDAQVATSRSNPHEPAETAAVVAVAVRELGVTLERAATSFADQLEGFEAVQKRTGAMMVRTQWAMIALTVVLAIAAAIQAWDILTRASTLPTVITAPAPPNR